MERRQPSGVEDVEWGSRRAASWVAGLNWYMNPLVKWQLNFERTVFDRNTGPRRPENMLTLQAQFGL